MLRSPSELENAAADELKAWYDTYGCVRPGRRFHRRQPGKDRPPRQEAVQHNPSVYEQEEVYEEIRSHLRLVALDLARGGFIRYSDVPDMEHDLFRSAIDELPKWANSVQFSRSVVSDSLQPHELQHARLPCPSPTPGVHPNPCPSSQ